MYISICIIIEVFAGHRLQGTILPQQNFCNELMDENMWINIACSYLGHTQQHLG